MIRWHLPGSIWEPNAPHRVYAYNELGDWIDMYIDERREYFDCISAYIERNQKGPNGY